MTNWIDLGRGGAIAAHRVIGAARANSAPVKRLLQAAGNARVINLTYGEPRETVLILEGGYLAVISLPLEAFLAKLYRSETP